LWYHDHLCKETSRNNYMGLSGLYIIEDPADRDLGLPSGRYDIPLVLQDRNFRADGSFAFKDRIDNLLGDTYLVNGRPMPYLEVANRRYRFRILNASHSRGYRLTLDTGEPLTQIGSDQGLLAAPAPAPAIPIWPAERVEIVVDFAKYPLGSKVVLQDLRDPTDPTSATPIMRFDVTRDEDDPSSLPAVLRQIERLVPGPETVEREFALSKNDAGKWVINGKAFDAGRIDIEPRLGNTEIWTFVNQSFFTHPMHIHLVRFQVLERNNMEFDASDLGWKDTVRVDPSTRVRVIMRFEGFPGRYMFHCHNLAHEDHSMMGQMRVMGDATTRYPSETGSYVGSSSRVPLPYACDLKL
ncbi:MAG: multicopper oxidase family protein, partial [Actinomycetota bacterium]